MNMPFFFFDDFQSALRQRIDGRDFAILEKRRNDVPLLSILLDTGVIRENKGALSFSVFGNWLFRQSDISPFFFVEQNERGGVDRIQSYSGSPFACFVHLLDDLENGIPHYTSRASIANRKLREVDYDLIKAFLSVAIEKTDVINGSIRITKSLAQGMYVIEFYESQYNDFSRKFTSLFTRLGFLPTAPLQIIKEAALQNALVFLSRADDGMSSISLPFATSINPFFQKAAFSLSEQKVLSYMARTRKALHRNDLIRHLGMPERSASRALVSLSNKGVIKRIGAKGSKDSFYKLTNKSIKI